MRAKTSLELRMAALLAVTLVWAPLVAQYPGRVDPKSMGKQAPILRAISVYEWTGELEKPKACRIVPIVVYNGEKLEDGGLYLSRPAPLAVQSDVEYQLEISGHVVGLFDVKNSAHEGDLWVGLGAPKPLPKEKTKKKPEQVKLDYFGESDKPVLYRKHATSKDGGTDAGADAGAGKGNSDAETSGGGTTAADDPDRPKLIRKDAPKPDDSASEDAGGQSAPEDPDRPKLVRKTEDVESKTDDPDRPKLIKKHTEADADSDNGGAIDPNRPRLRHGASEQFNLALTPQLKGLPTDANLAVAVSDATKRAEHLWKYNWPSADEEAAMREDLEAIARDALGMTTPPPAKPAKAKPGTRQKVAAMQTPSAPPELGKENFKSFELTYDGSATIVLTATNNLEGKDEKFVTLIAQPDLYGKPLVLLKQVTDLAHLDSSPRMRLVDAVDAMADNRGLLLFELRTVEERQFAFYRVLRGTAEKVFATGVAGN